MPISSAPWTHESLSNRQGDHRLEEIDHAHLGLGAGWSQREHAAYGILFPESVGERFDRLEEQPDFNLRFVSVQESAGLAENVRAVAGAAGRDLSTRTISHTLAVCAGRDETEASARLCRFNATLAGAWHLFHRRIFVESEDRVCLPVGSRTSCACTLPAAG